jgi:hypothetical protein
MLKWKRCFTLYTKLGRWNIDHDMKTINIKIDQANRDNSGSYSVEKKIVEESIIKRKTDKENEYLLPYCL